MVKIRCGGYKKPFDPFKRADGSLICEPTTNQLTMWASKLAPKQQDQWLAAASWNNEVGDRLGAMAWRAKNDSGVVTRGDVVWDNQPLPYDPRPVGQKESWGQHRPRYSGNGWWTGAVFADTQDVTISNPADVSATTYQLAPGVTIVPQLSVPFYGNLQGGEGYHFRVDGSYYFNSQGSRMTASWSPIAGYTAYAAWAFGPRTVGQIYKFNDAYYWRTGSVNEYTLGTVFGYSIFYPNMTPEQIPNSHEAAAPLARSPEPGDMVATYLGRSITYQASQFDYYYDLDPSGSGEYIPIQTPTIPAGTLVRYTWSQVGVERTAAITSRSNAIDAFGTPFTSLGFADDGINDRYGVNFKGTSGAAEVNRSGKCYIFEWWRDQYVLHEGTYSIKQKVKDEKEEDRPPSSSGPASGSNPWPGWPSKRNKCDRYAAGLASYTTTRPWEGGYDEATTPVTLTWTYFGQVLGSTTVDYKTATYRETPSVQESGVYDPSQGSPPAYNQNISFKDISFHAYYPVQTDLFSSSGGVLKITMVGQVERNALGDRVGGCWQESPPSINPALGANVGLGSDSSNTLSNGQPVTCAVYGQYTHGGLTTQSVQVRTAVLKPGSAPPVTPPNCPAEDARPGSDLPGFPTDPEVPGFPPGGHGNKAGAKRVSEVEVEYEIQAPIARGLTSRSYYYEKTSESKGGSAQWNGTSESSPYTPETSLSTTLEFREPVTLIRDDLAGFEEVIFAVLEFDHKTGSFPAKPPPPADRTTVYYQKEGGSPIALPESFKAEFPTAAWTDPRSWNWSQWMGLKDGTLYLYRHDTDDLDSYKSKNGKMKGDRFRVSDGSLADLGAKKFDAQSLGVPKEKGTIFDHNAFPQ